MRKTILWLCWYLTLAVALTALIVTSRPETASASAPVSVSVDTPAGPLAALTFDDGPSSAVTPALLDGLADRGVKATFFVLGAQARENPDLLRRMAAEGHQIGLHTWDHTALRGETAAVVADQLDRSREVLTNLLGDRDFLVRPPYGFYDATVRQTAHAPLILWSVDTQDWDHKDPSKIVDICLSQMEDGAIVLLHDIYPTSVEGALQTIDALTAQGYTFVTLDALFAARGIAPGDGEIYRSLPPEP